MSNYVTVNRRPVATGKEDIGGYSIGLNSKIHLFLDLYVPKGGLEALYVYPKQ